METYVLDKTFKSVGSIGTGICVRLGTGSPVGNTYRNSVKVVAGSLNPGSIMPIGVSVTGCSETGKEVIVRMLGIAKTKLAVTVGSIIQGKPAYAASKGKVRVLSPGVVGSYAVAMLGPVIYAEGGGSADGFIDVMVNPYVR